MRPESRRLNRKRIPPPPKGWGSPALIIYEQWTHIAERSNQQVDQVLIALCRA